MPFSLELTYPFLDRRTKFSSFVFIAEVKAGSTVLVRKHRMQKCLLVANKGNSMHQCQMRVPSNIQDAVFAISPLGDCFFFLIFKPIRNSRLILSQSEDEERTILSIEGSLFPALSIQSIYLLYATISSFIFPRRLPLAKVINMVKFLRQLCKPEFCGAQLKTALIYVRHKTHNSQMQYHDHHH